MLPKSSTSLPTATKPGLAPRGRVPPLRLRVPIRSRAVPGAIALLFILSLVGGSGLGVCAEALEPDGTYQGVELFPVGGQQIYAVASDFNRDGADDLFVLMLSGTEISVFSSGTEGYTKTTISGTFPNGLHAVVGLVDGDSFQDVVVTSRNGAQVFLGNGDGTFREGAFLKSIFFGRNSVITDVDRDGHPDILLGDEQAGAVLVYLGDGQGAFTEHKPPVSVQGEPHFFALADFDADGNSDFVFCMGVDDVIGVLLGNGDGTFKTPTFYEVGRNNRFVATGDFNRDGKPDVAVSNRLSETVSVLQGRGDGTLLPAVALPTVPAPELIDAVDFDGDRLLDILVVGGEDDGFFAVHPGKGDGTFRDAIIYAAGRAPFGMCMGDFNGDRLRDVLIANRGWDFASILLGKTAGGLQSPSEIVVSGEPFALAAADLDGDSRRDLVAALRNTGGLTLLFAREGGGFKDPAPLTAPEIPTDFVVADLDGQDGLDIAAADAIDGVTVWLGTGGGSFGAPGLLPVGLRLDAILAGDLDGGGTDLLVADRASGSVSLLSGNGDGTFRDPVTLPVGDKPTFLVSGDLNGDGRPDVACANEGSADLSLLLGKEGGGLLPEVRVPFSGKPIAAAAGDVDGDGAPDLIVADSDADRIAIFRGTKDGSTVQPVESAVEVATGAGPAAIALGSPGAGGKPEIFIACSRERAVFIHRCTGPTSFPVVRAYETGRSPVAVLCDDLTGDGLLDFATSDAEAKVIAIFIANSERPRPDGKFRRGHANEDGRLDISDPIGLLGYLFLGGTIAYCPDATDANDDGKVDLSDAVYVLGFLFLGGKPIPSPGPDDCGDDPTQDVLGECEVLCR